MNEIEYSLTLFFTVILLAFILSVISYCCTTTQSNTASQSPDGVHRTNIVIDVTDSIQTTTTTRMTVVEASRLDQTRICSCTYNSNNDNSKPVCSSSSSKANKLCDKEEEEEEEEEEGGGVSSSPSCCCSICLMDYKDSDLLRVLPDCGHFFHVNCVDPWFSMHLTCPICRTSVKNF